jgi:phosphoglycolate phosphatase
MTLPPPIKALCFDFDGVLVESTGLKTDAYVHFYRNRDSATQAAIRDYCDYHSGLSRQVKFAHIQDAILREPRSSKQLEALCADFRDLVLTQVLQAPLVLGALECLQACQGVYDCSIASGTPHDELQQICRERDLTGYFSGIGGSPTSKATWIRRILATLGLTPEQVVMIGDAPADRDAAAATGVHFVGVGKRPVSCLPFEEHLLPDLTGLLEHIAALRAENSLL